MNIGNIIADALTSIITGYTFVCITSSVRDSKFPVYVVHSVDIHSTDGKYRVCSSKRVHSREVDKEDVMRDLYTKTIGHLIKSAANGNLPIPSLELKY